MHAGNEERIAAANFIQMLGQGTDKSFRGYDTVKRVVGKEFAGFYRQIGKFRVSVKKSLDLFFTFGTGYGADAVNQNAAGFERVTGQIQKLFL